MSTTTAPGNLITFFPSSSTSSQSNKEFLANSITSEERLERDITPIAITATAAISKNHRRNSGAAGSSSSSSSSGRSSRSNISSSCNKRINSINNLNKERKANNSFTGEYSPRDHCNCCEHNIKNINNNNINNDKGEIEHTVNITNQKIEPFVEEVSAVFSPMRSLVDGSVHTVNFSMGYVDVSQTESKQRTSSAHKQTTPERNHNKANLSRYVREQINGYKRESQRYNSDDHLRRLWSAPPKLRDALTSPLIQLYASTHQNMSIPSFHNSNNNNDHKYQHHLHQNGKQYELKEELEQEQLEEEQGNKMPSYVADMDSKVQRRSRAETSMPFLPLPPHPLPLRATETVLHQEDSLITDAIDTLVQWKKPFKPVYFRDWYIYHYCSEESVKRLGVIQRCAGKFTMFFTWYLQAWSMTGEAEFYTLFLPTLVWVGRPLDGLQIASLLCMGQYLTSAIKDAICCPRPPCPPLELRGKRVTHNTEYGFPSTHSCHSGMFAYFLYCELIQLLPHTVVVCWLVAFLFFTHVSFSRIYLGMHWFGDLVGGWLAAFICVLFHVAFVNRWEELLISVHRAPWWAFVLLYVALHILAVWHPVPHDACPCYVDSMRFAGALAGGVAGFWLFQRQFHSITARPVAASLRNVHLTWFFIVEWVVCIAVVLLGEEAASRASKWALRPIFTFLSGAYVNKLPRLLRKPYLIMAKVVKYSTRGNAHGTTRFHPWNPNNSFAFMRSSHHNSNRSSVDRASNARRYSGKLEMSAPLHNEAEERVHSTSRVSSVTMAPPPERAQSEHAESTSAQGEMSDIGHRNLFNMSNNIYYHNDNNKNNNNNNNYNNNNYNNSTNDNTCNDNYSIADNTTCNNSNSAKDNSHNSNQSYQTKNNKENFIQNGTSNRAHEESNNNNSMNGHQQNNNKENHLSSVKDGKDTSTDNYHNEELAKHKDKHSKSEVLPCQTVNGVKCEEGKMHRRTLRKTKQREEEEEEEEEREEDRENHQTNGNIVHEPEKSLEYTENGSKDNYKNNGVSKLHDMSSRVTIYDNNNYSNSNNNNNSTNANGEAMANGRDNVHYEKTRNHNKHAEGNEQSDNISFDYRNDERNNRNNSDGNSDEVVEVPDGYIHPHQVWSLRTHSH